MSSRRHGYHGWYCSDVCHPNSRTGSVSPLDLWDTLGKCVFSHSIDGSAVYSVTSNISPTAQVSEARDVGPHPLPTKDDLGRFDDTAGDGHVTELSF